MGLEQIANETDYWNVFLAKTKRVAYIPWAVYWEGLKYREAQQKAAQKIGWQEKNLTILNALIPGLLTSAIYYLSGRESFDFISNSHWIEPIKDYFAVAWNIRDDIIADFANFLGISTRALFYSWSVFNTGQSLFRIYYAQKNKKAMPSISLWGALANTRYIIDFFLTKKEKHS